MSPEVALLNETWEIVRATLPPKERIHVADAILRVFDEHIDISEIHEYKNEFDKVMKTAIVDYFDDDESDDDEDWE